MKHLKLNFKSIVQNKARWLLTLFTILTLGVGQMWAYDIGGGTIYVDNYNENWKSIRIHMWNGAKDWSTDWIFTNISGTDYWYCETPGRYGMAGYLWAEGAKDEWTGNQTSDITADGAGTGWYTLCYDLDNGGWKVPGLKNVTYVSTTSVSNVLAGSGTEGSPYIVKPGTNIGVQLTGDLIDTTTPDSKACSKSFKFGTGDPSTTSTCQLVASAVAGTSYSKEGFTGATRAEYSSRYASAGTLYFTTAYNMAVANDGKGSASITSGGSYIYSGNTSFTVTASSPATGYEFDYWEINNASYANSFTNTTNPLTITAKNNGSITMTAHFKAINYTATNNIKESDDKTTNGQYNVYYDAESIAYTTEPSKTGYNLVGLYVEKAFTNKVVNSDRSLVSTTTTYTSGGKWAYTSAPTLYVKWAANTYKVRFNANGGSGSMDDQSFTYDASAQALTSCGFTKTGYHFYGWATSQANADSKTRAYTDGQSVSNLTATKDGTVDLYAIWEANTYSVAFNANGGSGDAMSNEAFTYDASAKALTTNTYYKNGYHFDGWALANDGDVVYTDGQEVSNLTSTADGTVTLYAHWTQVTLTDLTFDPVQAAPGEEVTITPVLSATPTGNSVICWGLFYDEECSHAVSPAVTFTSSPSSGSSTVTFTAPAVAGTYFVQGIYRAGTNCAGTEHNTYVEAYTLASDHTATIKYVCDGVEIAERGSVTVPAGDSVKIGPKEIIGYSFSSWSADPVITLGSRDGDSVKIGATYDGTVTATYTKKNMVYFNNTLGWDTIYVYFYKDGNYWGSTQGTGTNTGWYSSSYTGKHGGMKRVAPGSNIWYFDLDENEVSSSYTNVAFTSKEQNSADYFYDNNNVIRRIDYSTSLSMYVPLTGIDPEKLNGEFPAYYYHYGYWMNYPESTGYTLRIYEAKTKDVDDLIRAIPFEFPDSLEMPMALTVELAANRTYGFEIKRNDGNYYGNDGTMKFGASGDAAQTVWEFKTGTTYRCELKTSVAGDYTFTLSYGLDAKSAYNYRVGVHYPVSVGSYRVIYKDLAEWSQGSAHTASWSHPSRTILLEAGAEDTVSFYVAKGSTPTMKFQYAKSIDGEGVVTWRDTTGTTIGAICPDTISAAGVYNFVLIQPEDGGIAVSAVEPYTGNYYIRTNSVEGQWSNYLNSVHVMPYTDFSFRQEKDPYSHYFTKWVTSGTSISFTVANDYSSCVSDTLIRGISTAKDAAYSITDAGTGVMSGNANVRFMYNQSTNRLSRAYLSGSTTISDRFLVLSGSAKMYDADGNSLTDEHQVSGLNAHEMNFSDKQNWMYETTVQANPGANIQLTAKFNSIVQYMKGSAAPDSVELMGGTGTGKYKVHVVYDFKINRLVTAWVPNSADAIEDSLKINADVMIIRSHQGNPDAITFTQPEGKDYYGALTDVKTVYGVMQFNRWILNNRANPENTAVSSCAVEVSKDNWVYDETTTNTYHPVLSPGNQKSIYERALYYISFPFDVKLSDVFGFGTYWNEWYLEYYDGKNRAKNGYWIDSESNWKYVTTEMRNDFVLHAYEGYILGLDLDYMQYDNTSFWTGNGSEVELYFPSASTIDTISQSSVTVKIDTVGYQCTINRGTTEGDRRIKDSHWHCIGVPSYAALIHEVQTSDLVVDWSTQTVPYVYDWNCTDNTLTAVASSGMGSSFTFQPMHAYLVQYAKPTLTWAAAAATPIPSIVARRTEQADLKDCEFRLELQQNEAMIDQTYIRLTEDENVSVGFEFNYDLVKEMNSQRGNIYTMIGYEYAAANMLPLTEQTTVVPVGVKTVADGDYTFAIPNGTEGIGVTLIDNETGIRTSLSALDYTVNLPAGTYDNRFVLEISPITQILTDIENAEMVNGKSSNRKLIIDGILYIVKDGQIFDARGNRVQ